MTMYAGSTRYSLTGHSVLCFQQANYSHPCWVFDNFDLSVTAHRVLKYPSSLEPFLTLLIVFLKTMCYHSSISFATVSDHCPVHLISRPHTSQSTSRRTVHCYQWLMANRLGVFFCLECSWKIFDGCYDLNPLQAYVFPAGDFSLGWG